MMARDRRKANIDDDERTQLRLVLKAIVNILRDMRDGKRKEFLQ